MPLDPYPTVLEKHVTHLAQTAEKEAVRKAHVDFVDERTVKKGIRNMKARYLGHVVFYVKNLEQSLAFYRDIVGFQEVDTIFGGKAAALHSGRTHHELLTVVCPRSTRVSY